MTSSSSKLQSIKSSEASSTSKSIKSLNLWISRNFDALDIENRYKIWRCTFMYLSRLTSAAQFKSEIKKIAGDSVRDIEHFRKEITNNHYFFLTLKLVGVHVVTTKSRIDVLSFCSEHGVSKRDAKFLVKMRQNSRTVGALRRMVKSKWNGTVPSPSTVIRKCAKLLLKVEKIIAGVVKHKLKFVTIFQGVCQVDLLADVRARLIQQYYWAFEIRNNNPYHEERWAVQTIARYITNLQYHWSAAKRSGATSRDSIGMSRRKTILACEMTSRSNAEDWKVDETPDTLYQSVQTPEEHALSIASTIDARNILLMYGTSAKKLKLLHVLAGVDYPSFNKWLGIHKLLYKGETHADLQERVSRVLFLSYAASWLGLRPKRVKAWLGRIKKDLEAKVDGAVSDGNGAKVVPAFKPVFARAAFKTSRSLAA